MLSVDVVEKARSGRSGAPMGMVDIAEVLWNRHLKHSPANPHWPDRDRFMLSTWHGSMLIYALLPESPQPKAVIVATGSKTSLAMEVHAALAAESIATCVVSTPCSNVFDRQPRADQDQVLPMHLPAVVVEVGKGLLA